MSCNYGLLYPGRRNSTALASMHFGRCSRITHQRVDKLGPRIAQVCSLELQQQEQPPWAVRRRCMQRRPGHSALTSNRLELSMGHACLTGAKVLA